MQTNPYIPPESASIETVTSGRQKRLATPVTRWTASLIDAILIFLFVLIIGKIMAFIQIDSSYISFIILLSFLIIYEPLMVSFWRGSLGHKSLRLQVSMAENDANVSFVRAPVRFSIKALFGIISLFWMFGSKRQALHDLLTKTKVTMK